MPFYQQLGDIPNKRHVQFRKKDGSLYREQVFGTAGFVGITSILYHYNSPTMVKEVLGSVDVRPKIAVECNLHSRKLEGFNVVPGKDYLDSRVPIMFNSDLTIELASPPKIEDDVFYKNSDQAETIFVHHGSGVLETMFGNLVFGKGDYLVIPKGIIYRFKFNSDDNRLFIVASAAPVFTPKRYRNNFGQLLENSPYCERDFRTPSELVVHEALGDYLVKIKKNGLIHDYIYAAHPFDVVGWDGFLFPYAFNIKDFEPITGRIHLPAPYNHSNIDSDELLYYVDGDFMSRVGVKPGQLTLHPAGIVHGPHPGTIEQSIGQKETPETAVMVDTFKPLHLTQQALDLEYPDYHKSWVKK
jgi:homogentisate 1,2-dioxygenase